jgi:CRISPR/Cas system-associated protein Cas10 (large subunit of type III CRISPR-Cas system)
MSKYLYGASIQGIQSFIFQTNKLKEIVGGSELVEEICTREFQDLVTECGVQFEKDNVILQAAGNIKYQFNSKEDCQKIVEKFPRRVMEKAPGITVSQAVIDLREGVSYKEALQSLEDKLRIQRNKAKYTSNQISHFMFGETARRTGGIGVKYDNRTEVIDATQEAKLSFNRKASKRLYESLTGLDYIKNNQKIFDMEDLTGPKEGEGELQTISSKSNWIAVVHADGNNLGKKLIAMYDNLDDHLIKNAVKVFSEALDHATKLAVQEAYAETVAPQIEARKLSKIPIRPIVIGGDDVTVVLKGDLAVPFTNAFLKAFEKFTKELFAKMEKELSLERFNLGLSEGLTACAGIAFIKPKYPFHYGADLAEELCSKAKKHSKLINSEFSPSSLLFHKVQSSFIDDMVEIEKQELTTKDGLRFDYGPYFLNEQRGFDTVDTLLYRVGKINRPSAPKSKIREWLGTVRDDATQADYLMERIKEILKPNSAYVKDLSLTYPKIKRGDHEYTHLYDLISLSNI